MAGKREKPEEIVSKLRQVEVLQGQGDDCRGGASDRRYAADISPISNQQNVTDPLLDHAAICPKIPDDAQSPVPVGICLKFNLPR